MKYDDKIYQQKFLTELYLQKGAVFIINNIFLGNNYPKLSF